MYFETSITASSIFKLFSGRLYYHQLLLVVFPDDKDIKNVLNAVIKL